MLSTIYITRLSYADALKAIKNLNRKFGIRSRITTNGVSVSYGEWITIEDIKRILENANVGAYDLDEQPPYVT